MSEKYKKEILQQITFKQFPEEGELSGLIKFFQKIEQDMLNIDNGRQYLKIEFKIMPQYWDNPGYIEIIGVRQITPDEYRQQKEEQKKEEEKLKVKQQAEKRAAIQEIKKLSEQHGIEIHLEDK